MTILAFSASDAYAALNLRTTPDPTWMTNGNVYATALSEDGKTLYIGGRFTQVREKPPGQGGKVVRANGVAAINTATGVPIATWHPSVTGDSTVTPTVRALVV